MECSCATSDPVSTRMGDHSLSRLAWSWSAATWRRSTFIKWTGGTLAMALRWWQHHNNCLGIIIIIIIIINGNWKQKECLL